GILNEKEGLQDECINSYQSQMYLFGIELKKKILHQKFRAEFISKPKYSDKGTSRMTNEKQNMENFDMTRSTIK
ncbi:hypothetical protein Tco_0453539, partial [Tanacetum coccineum]